MKNEIWKRKNYWTWNKNNSLSRKEFYSRLKIAHPFIENVSNYRGSSHIIMWLCNRCGWSFKRSPKKLLNGSGCPNCEIYYVYLVRLHKYGCYKIGVTHNIYSRMKGMGGGTLIFYRKGTKKNAYLLEEIWLNNVKDYKVRKDFRGGTETFEYKFQD